MKNKLVAAWLAVEMIPGQTKTMALADLNEVLGTRHDLSMLGRWANGKRPLPPAVRQYMGRVAISHILQSHGIKPGWALMLSDEHLDGIADTLTG